MATFTQWLTGQTGRNDPVGEFARYWKDLDRKPRLSSPASIATYLEDLEPGGFRDSSVSFHHAPTLRAAYDATLKEYRSERAQVAQAVVDSTGSPAGPSGDSSAEQAAAGLMDAVEQTQQAAQIQAAVPASTAGVQPGQPGYWSAVIGRVEAKLDQIMTAMGLAYSPASTAGSIRPDDEGAPYDGPFEAANWAQWWEQAMAG